MAAERPHKVGVDLSEWAIALWKRDKATGRSATMYIKDTKIKECKHLVKVRFTKHLRECGYGIQVRGIRLPHMG